MQTTSPLWGIVLCLLGTGSVAGQDSTLPPAVSGQTTYEELAVFGEAVEKVGAYRDNRYLYDARVLGLLQRSQAFEQALVEFTVTVDRVTLEEVLVSVRDAGHTRVLLQHVQSPQFGNLRTVYYGGAPSALFYNQFAKPVGLRIGTEISLPMAMQLRKRDQLLIQARIGCMRVIIGPTYRPFTIATMSDWTVLKAIPANADQTAPVAP